MLSRYAARQHQQILLVKLILTKTLAFDLYDNELCTVLHDCDLRHSWILGYSWDDGQNNWPPRDLGRMNMAMTVNERVEVMKEYGAALYKKRKMLRKLEITRSLQM